MQCSSLTSATGPAGRWLADLLTLQPLCTDRTLWRLPGWRVMRSPEGGRGALTPLTDEVGCVRAVVTNAAPSCHCWAAADPDYLWGHQVCIQGRVWRALALGEGWAAIREG